MRNMCGEKEMKDGGTENPIETEDHKFVVAIIYGF